MRKSIPTLRHVGYKSSLNVSRIQKSYREKAFVVIPPVMRICAMSNGEHRLQVLLPVVQGLSQKQQQFRRRYFATVDGQGLMLRRPRGDNEIV